MSGNKPPPSWTKLVAFRQFLFRPNNPHFCNYSILGFFFFFELLGCQKVSPSCWDYTDWHSVVATVRCAKKPMLPRLRTQPSQRRYMPACTTKLSRAGELAPQPSQKDTESPNALCSLFRACVQVASVFSNTLLSVHARLRVCWDHRGRFVFGFEHIVLVTCLLL